MKTKNLFSAIALSGLLFSGVAAADGNEDDLLHGNRPIAASPGEAWLAVGIETQQADDLLHGGGPVNASPHSGFERIADDREFSTDIVYGS